MSTQDLKKVLIALDYDNEAAALSFVSQLSLMNAD